MEYKINYPEELDEKKAQEFLEYLREDLEEALEKTNFKPRSSKVLKASERLNKFLEIYID